MFRGAAGQYRLLATRIEQRIREYSLMDDEEREDHKQLWKEFFDEQNKIIMTAQSEMKYFPPNAVIKAWIKKGMMSPNPVDQPGLGPLDKVPIFETGTGEPDEEGKDT